MCKCPEEGLDKVARDFGSYEDFLDSQITERDLFYLEDEELARKLVELGYRGTGEVIKREDFDRKKEELAIEEEKRKIAKKDMNAKGQEISGYIDYAHRLKTDDFTTYFSGKTKLMPRVGDLSYFNWESQYVSSASTPNYTVIADNPNGLLFKNKRDRKFVIIDPWSHAAGDNTTRIAVYTNRYKQFVLYDHITRRKT